MQLKWTISIGALLLLLLSACSSLPTPPEDPIKIDPVIPSPGSSASITVEGCPMGDADGDSDVDGADYLEWQRNFGNIGINSADFNKNWEVDAADYTVWRNNFGQKGVCPPPPTTTTASIDALVQGKPVPTNFKVFTSYSATGGNTDMAAVWDRTNWAESVNLSPVAWHDNWCWGEPKVCTSLGMGVAITKRHILTHHQHGTEGPGAALQFLRKNGEVVTRWTTWQHEVASNLFRILWMTEDLPDDMVAPLPSKSSVMGSKPIAILNGPKEVKLNYTTTSNPEWIYVNGAIDPDPVRQKYKGGGVGGDSGKPLFAIIGREMVPVAIWWTPGGGTSIPYYSDEIIKALDRLSTTMGDVRMLKPKVVRVE